MVYKLHLVVASGPMKHWYNLESVMSDVFHMVSDFLSAPGVNCRPTYADLYWPFLLHVAASTDTERAFSKRWQQVNFMQHGLLSQTFKLEMTVSSQWDNTPLFPSISDVVKIIQQATHRVWCVDRYKLKNVFFTFLSLNHCSIIWFYSFMVWVE